MPTEFLFMMPALQPQDGIRELVSTKERSFEEVLNESINLYSSSAQQTMRSFLKTLKTQSITPLNKEAIYKEYEPVLFNEKMGSDFIRLILNARHHCLKQEIEHSFTPESELFFLKQTYQRIQFIYTLDCLFQNEKIVRLPEYQFLMDRYIEDLTTVLSNISRGLCSEHYTQDHEILSTYFEYLIANNCKKIERTFTLCQTIAQKHKNTIPDFIKGIGPALSLWPMFKACYYSAIGNNERVDKFQKESPSLQSLEAQDLSLAKLLENHSNDKRQIIYTHMSIQIQIEYSEEEKAKQSAFRIPPNKLEKKLKTLSQIKNLNEDNLLILEDYICVVRHIDTCNISFRGNNLEVYLKILECMQTLFKQDKGNIMATRIVYYLESLTHRYREHLDSQTSMNSDLREPEEELAAIQKGSNSKKNKTKKKNKSNQPVPENITQLQKELKALELQNAELKKKADHKAQIQKESLEKAQKEIDSLSTQKMQMEQEQAALKEQWLTLQTQIQQNNTEMLRSITELETKKQSLKNKILSYKAKADLQTQDLQRTVDNNKKSEKAIRELEATIKELKDSIPTSKATLAKLEEDLAMCQIAKPCTLSSLKSEPHDKHDEEEISQLSFKIKKLEADNAQALVEHSDLKAAITHLKKELEELSQADNQHSNECLTSATQIFQQHLCLTAPSQRPLQTLIPPHLQAVPFSAYPSLMPYYRGIRPPPITFVRVVNFNPDNGPVSPLPPPN